MRDLVDDAAGVLSGAGRERIVDLILRDTVGLGPLEELLADREVEELMVNGHDHVYVERRGRIERSDVRFESDSSSATRSSASWLRSGGASTSSARWPTPGWPTARESTSSSPARGRRPRALGAPIHREPPGPRRAGRVRNADRGLRALLADAVGARRSILVSGGTGSGKTTLLNALSAWIGPDERVVTIEDAAELRLRQTHVVRLESRPASVEGREVAIRDLLRNALRMRPDRIVIGEVRGAEALDLLTALNTGHDGALSTVHANSPADALRRVETLALMAGIGLPHEAIREQLARGVDLVHMARGEEVRAW